MRSASNPADAFPPTSGKSRTPVHCLLLKCYVTSTETEGLLGTGTQDGHLDFYTAWLLSSESTQLTSVKQCSSLCCKPNFLLHKNCIIVIACSVCLSWDFAILRHRSGTHRICSLSCDSRPQKPLIRLTRDCRMEVWEEGDYTPIATLSPPE